MPGEDERLAERLLARLASLFALDADLQQGGEVLPRPHNPEASVSRSRLAIGVGAHASLSQIDGSDTPG
jgi:hypothetical protein